MRRSWFASLAVSVLVRVVLKFFFGWNISIIGSVVVSGMGSVWQTSDARRWCQVAAVCGV